MRTSTYQSIQTAGILFLHIRGQSLSVSDAYLWSEHSPTGIYSLGAHCSELPPSSRDGGLQIKYSQVKTGASSGHTVTVPSTMSGSG